MNIDFVSANEQIKRSYINLIPNLSINKSWKEFHSIGFGFSQRIKRPGVRRLNPFVDRSNPNFETSGNPNLREVVNNDVMINYSYNKKIFFNAGLSYSFSNKIDLKVSVYDPVSKITRTTYQNTSKASRLGIDYSLNYPVTRDLNFSLNGNFAQFFIQGIADEQLITNNLFTYYLSFSSGYKLNTNWQLNASLEVNSNNPGGLQTNNNGFVSTSFNISRSLLKDKLSLSAFINNPFTKYRQVKMTNFGQNFSQLNSSYDYFRSFGFSVDYRFGRLKNQDRRTKKNVRNDDVAN